MGNYVARAEVDVRAPRREVWTVDARLEVPESGKDVLGIDNIIAWVSEAVGDQVSVHHGHMPNIEVTSADTATGIWALNDIVIFPTGVRLDGYGHYHETYVKADGEWRIASSTLTRLHMDFSTPS